MAESFLRLGDVRRRVALSASTIYARMQAGDFPMVRRDGGMGRLLARVLSMKPRILVLLAILTVAATALAYRQPAHFVPQTDRQKWDAVIEAHVGPPYLDQYRADRAAGRPSPWDYVEDDPKLPRVLLIGDSISRAYTLPVRGLLAGKANVHRAPQNCLSTTYAMHNLDLWLGDGRWDVIHFNFGIHDKKTPIDKYERQLDAIAWRLQKTGARVIWASTTPTLDDAEGIAQRNAVAAKVMARYGIPTDDLSTIQATHLPDGVHWTEAGNQALGVRVAGVLANALEPVAVHLPRPSAQVQAN